MVSIGEIFVNTLKILKEQFWIFVKLLRSFSKSKRIFDAGARVKI